MNCIFCNGPAMGSSVSHILPASLGGEEWACLPDGLVCSRCNQYFGEKVESLALHSFPFLPFRVLLGIPTKRGAAPEMPTNLGKLRGSLSPGSVGMNPVSDEIEKAIAEGRITQVRILAEPTEPLAVCRMLVKMGLELVAANSPEWARSPRFDAARTFARRPAKGMDWWFYIYTDHNKLFERFRNGITGGEWSEGVSLSLEALGDIEVFRLHLLGMIVFTPLIGRVLPPEMDDFPAPDHRLFRVRN